MERNTAKLRPSFLYRFRHFIIGPNPLHPAIWENRLPQVTFRRFTLADLPQCLEIYKLNAPGRFPEDVISQYEEHLRTESTYFLVAEREGRIVATGGMSYYVKPHLAIFSFGLVPPDQQGKGLGTALFLARLALLNECELAYRIFIFAVEKSMPFYQRFGFRPHTPWADKQGAKHPSGYLIVHSEEAQECRKLLSVHGISVPHDEDQVPLKTKE